MKFKVFSTSLLFLLLLSSSLTTTAEGSENLNLNNEENVEQVADPYSAPPLSEEDQVFSQKLMRELSKQRGHMKSCKQASRELRRGFLGMYIGIYDPMATIHATQSFSAICQKGERDVEQEHVDKFIDTFDTLTSDKEHGPACVNYLEELQKKMGQRKLEHYKEKEEFATSEHKVEEGETEEAVRLCKKVFEGKGEEKEKLIEYVVWAINTIF